MGENYITSKAENGSINISDDVITSIIKTAAAEVDGVASLTNTVGEEIAGRIGFKTASKGIKVLVEDNKLTADVIITVTYGNNIIEVAKNVQEKAISALQAITGIEDACVNVHVSGVEFEK